MITPRNFTKNDIINFINNSKSSHSTKKIRLQAINKVPENITFDILNVTDTINKIKSMCLSNCYTGVILKTLGHYSKGLSNTEATEATDMSVATDTYFKIGYQLANKPNKEIVNKVITKDQLIDIATTETIPIKFRIILALFIDAPLRSGDFRCIYIPPENSIPSFIEYNSVFDDPSIKLLKNTPSLIQMKQLIFIKGTKKRANYPEVYKYNCSELTQKLISSYKEPFVTNYKNVNTFCNYIKEYLQKYLGISTFNDLRHSVITWQQPENMHHTILTHYADY